MDKVNLDINTYTIKELENLLKLEDNYSLEDIDNKKTKLQKQISLSVIANLLKVYEIQVDIDDRIIPILRFQATYELCPENISVLENLFKNGK